MKANRKARNRQLLWYCVNQSQSKHNSNANATIIQMQMQSKPTLSAPSLLTHCHSPQAYSYNTTILPSIITPWPPPSTKGQRPPLT